MRSITTNEKSDEFNIIAFGKNATVEFRIRASDVENLISLDEVNGGVVIYEDEDQEHWEHFEKRRTYLIEDITANDEQLHALTDSDLGLSLELSTSRSQCEEL